MSDLKQKTSQMTRIAKAGGLAVLIIAVLAVGGAFAYDAAKKDQISPGVQIAGIDVGGNSADEARSLIRRSVVAPLMRPVKVEFEGQTYDMTPRDLDMKADVDAMVDEALDASREGGLPTRLVRYATDSAVHKDLPPRISYSQDELDDEVQRIADEINRDPVDATITPGPDSVTPTKGEDGVEVDEEKLHDDLEAALQQGYDRDVEPDVTRVPPEVTTKELAAEYPTYVTIDRGNFVLTLWKNLKVKKRYGIAVGQAGLETPEGEYEINDKQVNPTWHVPNSDWAGDLAGQSIPPGPGNPLVARWMGFYNGAGIHGTDQPDSIGTAASHGCVRMRVDEVIELYDMVPEGTPIYIGN